jgi:hypothetical protein
MWLGRAAALVARRHDVTASAVGAVDAQLVP